MVLHSIILKPTKEKHPFSQLAQAIKRLDIVEQMEVLTRKEDNYVSNSS